MNYEGKIERKLTKYKRIMTATKFNPLEDLITQVFEAYHTYLNDEEFENQTPLEVADAMSNENDTALLYDMMMVSKTIDPYQCLGYLQHQKEVLSGMQQLLTDLMVACVEMNDIPLDLSEEEEEEEE